MRSMLNSGLVSARFKNADCTYHWLRDGVRALHLKPCLGPDLTATGRDGQP